MNGMRDSGLIQSLPDGWIDPFVAARRFYNALIEKNGNGDLAPWIAEATSDSCSSEDFEIGISRRKIRARVSATFQRAFWRGDLTAEFFENQKFHVIPKHAYAHLSAIEYGLLNGRLKVDPLWPDDLWAWNLKCWAIPKEQFEGWLSSGTAFSIEGLPIETPLADSEAIERLAYREPSQRTRVSLTEAYTWIAFRIALGADRLEEALRWNCLKNGDLQQAQLEISTGVEELLNAGSDGKISFFGRLLENSADETALTDKIEAYRLDDYRSYHFGFDNLHFGSGPIWALERANSSRLEPSKRRDFFADVTVSRDDLLRHFPVSNYVPTAFVASPIGASSAMPARGMAIEQRYDDTFRGPSIRDGKRISDWRYDLLNAGIDWKLPPPHFSEFFLNFYTSENLEQAKNQSANDTHTVNTMIAALKSGELPTYYALEDGREVLVDPHALVKLDYASIMAGCYRPIGEEHASIFGRPLFCKNDDWVRFMAGLEAKHSRIVEIVPPAKTAHRGNFLASAETPILRTGDPGRPSKGYHIYSAEHSHRCSDGVAHQTLADEAKYLVSWFKNTYPTADPINLETVKNRIRDNHRAYREGHKNIKKP